ncbi:hypothetical protein VTP01DRAFT_6041 [Rhizomucor pusillus]|uniref:uncharacterized protein n=1 Tax=Rhizomucor pusillus TaxID=4840 RepID=UPI003742FE0C
MNPDQVDRILQRLTGRGLVFFVNQQYKNQYFKHHRGRGRGGRGRARGGVNRCNRPPCWWRRPQQQQQQKDEEMQLE